ncbi:hypothetical protein D3C79_943250 [compost metagenome]
MVGSVGQLAQWAANPGGYRQDQQQPDQAHREQFQQHVVHQVTQRTQRVLPRLLGYHRPMRTFDFGVPGQHRYASVVRCLQLPLSPS